MVADAGDWRWSSFGLHGAGRTDDLLGPVPAYDALSATPAGRRERWSAFVHRPPDAAELSALRRSVATGLPYGDAAWVDGLGRRLGLDLETRPRGRPLKTSNCPA